MVDFFISITLIAYCSAFVNPSDAFFSCLIGILIIFFLFPYYYTFYCCVIIICAFSVSITQAYSEPNCVFRTPCGSYLLVEYDNIVYDCLVQIVPDGIWIAAPNRIYMERGKLSGFLGVFLLAQNDLSIPYRYFHQQGSCGGFPPTSSRHPSFCPIDVVVTKRMILPPG